MVEVQVDVWAKIRLQHWWRRGIIGHNSRGMSAIIRGSVQFAKLPRVNLRILVYTCLCLFHKHHGRIYLWTLYWVFLEPNMVWIFFFLLWLTGTQRCPISQHARRLQMLLEWPICSLKKFGICMECQSPSPPTRIPSSLVTSGGLCGSVLTLP